MTRKLKLSELKPVGNFNSILISLKTKAETIISLCLEKNEYNSSLSEVFKFNCEILEALRESIIENQVWNIDDARECLLYSAYLSIKINHTSHTLLNPGLVMPSVFEQFQEYLDDLDPKLGIEGIILIEE